MNNFAELQLLTMMEYLKKETLAQMFPCEFCEISKNTFFTEHLCTTASEVKKTVFNYYVQWSKVNDRWTDFYIISMGAMSGP